MSNQANIPARVPLLPTFKNYSVHSGKEQELPPSTTNYNLNSNFFLCLTLFFGNDARKRA